MIYSLRRAAPTKKFVMNIFFFFVLLGCKRGGILQGLLIFSFAF